MAKPSRAERKRRRQESGMGEPQSEPSAVVDSAKASLGPSDSSERPNNQQLDLRDFPRPEESKQPHWTLWFFEIVVGIILAGGSAVQSVSFTVPVILVYAYTLACLVHIWYDRRIKTFLWVRLIVSLVVVGLAGWYGFGFVWAADPLIVSGVRYSESYPTGAVIGGIPWIKEYVDLHLTLDNQTSNDYRNLDIFIDVGQKVMKSGQITNLPGLTFLQPNHGQSGIRLRCDKIPNHAKVEVILALFPQQGPAISANGVYESLGARPRRLNALFLATSEAKDMAAIIPPSLPNNPSKPKFDSRKPHLTMTEQMPFDDPLLTVFGIVNSEDSPDIEHPQIQCFINSAFDSASQSPVKNVHTEILYKDVPLLSGDTYSVQCLRDVPRNGRPTPNWACIDLTVEFSGNTGNGNPVNLVFRRIGGAFPKGFSWIPQRKNDSSSCLPTYK